MKRKPSYSDLQAEIEELKLKLALLKSAEKHKLSEAKGFVNWQLDEDLQENEEFVRYKMLAEATLEAIVILHNGKCIESNAAACKLFNYSYDEMLGLNALDVIHNDYKELVRTNISSDFLEPYEVVALRKDGSMFEAEMQGQVFFHNDQKLRITAIRNIHNRKVAEAEIIQKERKFRVLFENAGFGIVMGNTKGEMIEVNQSFCNLLKLSPDQLLNKHISEIFCPSSIAEKPLQFETLNNRQSLVMERTIKRADNTCIPIEMNSKKLNDDYYLALFRDLTLQKKTESELLKINKQLKRAKEKAEESDRLKSFFLTNMSHEIRTPMNGIIGFSELLGDPDLSESKRLDYSNIIVNSGNQLMRIIDDILEISKLETKQVVVNYSQVCLNDFLMELFNLFSQKAKDQKLSLYIRKSLDDSRSVILSDLTKLRKITYNLVENALRYTNNGYIEIAYRIEKSEILLVVKDSGIGIDEKHKIIIFDRFSQADKTLSSKFGGLGLGLSIARENAELLGGSIQVDSTLGEGSTFTVRLPNKSTTEFDEDTAMFNYKILIAEDEEVNALYLSILLERYKSKINILQAKNGMEAVELVRLNPDINLVFMDLKMPVMDGFTATEQIVKLNSNITVIAHSAHVSQDVKDRAMSIGCKAFVTKPVSELEITNVLTKFLK